MKKWFSIKNIGIILLIICLSGLIFANIEVRENQEPGEKINILEDETYKKYKKYLRHEDLSTGNRKSVKGQNHENGWKIESDASGDEVIGSNLTSVGHSTEGNGCVYTTNRRYYGNEQEDNNMTIYQLKEDQWEVVVSYPEPSLSGLLDGKGGVIYDRYIWDLTYYKGYVYYILVDDYMPGEGIGKEYYLCRVSEQNGQEEKLGECFSKFYIYNDKIYYMTQNAQEDIRFFWEMALDGSYTKLVHCQKPGHCARTGRDFAVGGGSLYWAEYKNGIRAINLETKKEKFLAVNIDYGIDGIYYANGNLYIDGGLIYQLNLNSGDIRKIVDTRSDAIWIYNGYLYYVVDMMNENCFNFYFRRRDLLTNEVIKWYEIEIPRNDNLHVPIIHLESAGNNILVKMETRYFPESEDGSKYEYSYFMKKLDEIPNYSCR